MLRDVIILVPVHHIFFEKPLTHILIFVSTFFTRKGTLTLTPGRGRGHLGHEFPQIKKSPKNPSYENCSHFWDIFPKMFKNLFKISSYIEKMTTNPINALKITIYNTKRTQNTKVHFEQIQNARTLRTHSKTPNCFLLYIKFP